MQKRLHIFSTLFFLLTLSAVFSADVAQNTRTGTWYSTIQAAVTAASPGDRIEVIAGTYNENIVINKSMALVGQSYTDTIINGGGGWKSDYN